MCKGVIENVLQCLDRESIAYVSWKNNHEMERSLSGGRDIDIFVPVNVKNKFASLLKKEGWLRMDNLFIRYPWVAHYYKLSKTGQVFHVHVYHKLVTGESLAKEYELPWSSFLIENRVRNKHGIWVLNQDAQAFIFFVRHLLKGGRLFSRYRYKVEFESYKEEFRQAGNVSELPWEKMPMDLSAYINGSGLDGGEFKIPDLWVAMRFRRTMKTFKRQGFLKGRLVALRVFNSRLINKLFIKSKKVLLDGGTVIAITGGDGSGKTTMLKSMTEELKAFATVKELHMGRPLPKWLEGFIRILKSHQPKKEHTVSSSATSLQEVVKIKKSTAVIATLIAVFRLYRARQAMAYARKGYIVLADRWPTREYGKMDGPVIIPEFPNNLFMSFLRKIEKKSYDTMPEADMCFVFQVPIAVAIERNAGRDESEEEQGLILRHKKNSDPKPICVEKVLFNNDGDIEPQKEKFREMVWVKINELV